MEVKEDGKQQSTHWRNAVGSGFPLDAAFRQDGTGYVKINLFQQACWASPSWWSGEMVICPREHRCVSSRRVPASGRTVCWAEGPTPVLQAGGAQGRAGPGRAWRGWQLLVRSDLSGPAVLLSARSLRAETQGRCLEFTFTHLQQCKSPLRKIRTFLLLPSAVIQHLLFSN